MSTVTVRLTITIVMLVIAITLLSVILAYMHGEKLETAFEVHKVISESRALLARKVLLNSKWT